MYATSGPGNYRPEGNYQSYQNGNHYGYAQNGQYDGYPAQYQAAPPPPPPQGAPPGVPPPPPQQTQQAPPQQQQQQQQQQQAPPPPNHQGPPPPNYHHHPGYQNYGYGYQNTYQSRPMGRNQGYNQMNGYNQNGNMYNQQHQAYGNGYQNGYNNGYGHQQQQQQAGPYGGGGDQRYMQKWNSMNSFSHMKAVDWNQVTNLVDIVKNFYVEGPQVQGRSDEEVAQWRQEKQVRVQGTMQIKPILAFHEIQLPPFLQEAIHRQSYEAPTTIQSQAWPIALSGADMVGIARTGSGKTLAFCLPALIHILAQPPLNHGDGPIALVLSPTRELAKQVEEVARTFGKPCGIHSVAVYGGADKNSQISQLNKGAHIVVACPGRLLDLINQKHVNLHRTTYVVMDEADRMLDMGFEPQIRKVVGQIRKDRQTLMFSATWPQTVQKLANDFMNDPTQIYIGHQGLAANANITQIVEVIQEEEKADKFNAFFHTAAQEGQKILVFTDTKRECDSLAWSLNRAKHRTCAAIHGDKDQRERERVLKDFRDGRITTLIAADVAARGLDIDAVGYVINYDFPHTVEDYVHRIGRTGRADNAGTAYSLITEKHSKCVHDLIKVLENANQKVPDELYKLKQQQRNRRGYVPRGRGRGYGGGGHNTGYRNDNYSGRGGGMMRGGGAPRGGAMMNGGHYGGRGGGGGMSRGGGPPQRGGGAHRGYRGGGGGGMNGGHYQKHNGAGGGPGHRGGGQNGGTFGQTWNGPPDMSTLSINN